MNTKEVLSKSENKVKKIKSETNTKKLLLEVSKQPKVSIIVPIYKVEKYLRKCVDSILAQTLKDIEVILVDDGSPDTCGEIIDLYAKKDKRVIAIHQPNGGYGKAVNHGIHIASGEYIGIIESDDWIEPTMYEKLYKNAKKNNTDVTKCGFYRYNSKLPKSKQNVIWEGRYQKISDMPHDVFNAKKYPLILTFHASIWSNIYKRSFLEKNNIYVIESKSASYQDFPFMVEVMCKAERISVVHDYLVHYRMEEGQNSSTMRRDQRLLIMADMCQEGKKKLKEAGLYDAFKEEFYFHSFLANIGFYHSIYLKYKYQYFKKLHDLFKEIKNDKTFTYKYFDFHQRNFVNSCVHNRYLNTFLNLKNIRRWFISIRINKRNPFYLQLFGIRISRGTNFCRRKCLLNISF